MFAALTAASLAVGCKEEDRVGVGDADAAALPTMLTRDVETLVSDSGITKFKITTPVWYVYDEGEAPHWLFPEGLWLEKYDPDMKIEATITADSATYFKQKQLWRLDGHVDISNTDGSRFLTPQLFWDQRMHKLYSDSFIHIEQPSQVLEGFGFDSNEQLTRYNVRSVSGIFPTNSFRGGSRQQADAESPAQDRQTAPASAAPAPAASEPTPALAKPDRESSPSSASSSQPLQLKTAQP